MPRYVQPAARHLAFPGRLLLRAEDDRWFVWTGEDERARPEEIAAPTARWLMTRSWMVPFPAEGGWVSVDDLPLASEARPAPRV